MSFDLLGYEDRNAWITTTNIPNPDNAPSSHQVRRVLSGYDSVSYESDQCESVKRPAMDAATNEVSEPTKPDTKIKTLTLSETNLE